MHVECCRIFNDFGNKPKANSTKKGKMKNGDIQHLIMNQNVASEDHTDDSKDIFLPKVKIPLRTSNCWKTSAKVTIMMESCHSLSVN